MLALTVVAFIPTILGSDWARGRIARWLTAETGVELHIGRLDLSWRGPQEVGGISARVPDGEFAGDELAHLESARLDASLWNLISGPGSVSAKARGLHLMVDERGNGRTSLDTLLRRLAARSLMALSPGAVSQDIVNLPFKRIRRPMYPFDPAMTWHPEGCST